MNDETELKPLISLLDDPDDAIFENVSDKIIEIGPFAIPFLLKSKNELKDGLLLERIDKLLDVLKYNKFESDINAWLNQPANDLLEGCLIISRFWFPVLKEQELFDFFDILEKQISSKLGTGKKSPEETIKIFNTAIIKELGFIGNVDNYAAISNSFLNQVVSSRKGNPIMLSVIYIIIAQRLNIPIYGVNSPGHFVLSYLNKKDSKFPDIKNDTLFYIDPFNGGVIYSVDEINKTIDKIESEVNHEFNLNADNNAIIKRILNNLIHGLSKEGKNTTAQDLYTILKRITE